MVAKIATFSVMVTSGWFAWGQDPVDRSSPAVGNLKTPK